MQVLHVVVKQLGVGHTHEYQMRHAGSLGGVDGGTALLKFEVSVFLGGAKIIGDDKHLFGATLGQSPVQVGAQRVVADHRLHAQGCQCALG